MDNELFLVRYYLGLTLRHPLRWLLPALLFIVIGTVIVLQAPRTYVSVARVALQSSQASGSLVQSTVTNERLQFFEQRVFSRQNLVALADRLALLPQRGGLTDGQVADIIRQRITLEVRSTEPANPSSNSAVLTIGFTADTPEMAAAGANEIIETLIVENRNARLSEANQLRLFLEQEVTARRQQAEQLDAEWNEFVTTNEALLPSRLVIYTTEIQELQQELQTIQVASAALAADTRVLETQLALAQSPLSGEENQLSELRQELSAKRTTFSDSHPDIISLRSRIATLEASLAEKKDQGVATTDEQQSPVSAESAMLNDRVASAGQQQEAYAARRAVIEERLDWLRATIAKMPAVEASLLALQRRHTAVEANLTDMQARLDTALVGERLENAQMDAQISVIDKPEVPTYAGGAGRTRALMIVGALGIGFGLACLVLLDLLDRSIKSKRNLYPFLEGGTLALIPDWTPEKARGAKGSLAAWIGVLALANLAVGVDTGPAREPITASTPAMASYS